MACWMDWKIKKSICQCWGYVYTYICIIRLNQRQCLNHWDRRSGRLLLVHHWVIKGLWDWIEGIFPRSHNIWHRYFWNSCVETTECHQMKCEILWLGEYCNPLSIIKDDSEAVESSLWVRTWTSAGRANKGLIKVVHAPVHPKGLICCLVSR